jgi:DUF971 family protein
MSLVQFKKNPIESGGHQSYHLKFNDGFECDLTPELLRDNCPCASCKGEEVLFHKYVPEKQEISTEGYKLDNVTTIGNYAIQLFWKDGHNTGIYTWDTLRNICKNFSKHQE